MRDRARRWPPRRQPAGRLGRVAIAPRAQQIQRAAVDARVVAVAWPFACVDPRVRLPSASLEIRALAAALTDDAAAAPLSPGA